MADAYQAHYDETLIKMILKSIQDGDIEVFKSYLANYSLDLKLLKDKEQEQNAFFFAALVQKDEE